MLGSALEYGGNGIVAGTQTIIPIPEPGPLVLTGVGGLILAWRRWKNSPHEKLGSSLIVAALLLASLRPSCAQGFVNLNFESAVITPDPTSPYYPNAVYASNAIPGWIPTGFLGPNQILYNSASLGSTSVSILGTNGTPSSLSGRYSILLYGGSTAASASISQTALLPVDAASILFDARYSGPPGGILLVSLGGQNIPFSVISAGANYTVYGGDISAYAGQNRQLMFSALAGENFWEIDDIQFSTSPIPEPSVLALAGVGGLLLVWRCRKARVFSR